MQCRMAGDLPRDFLQSPAPVPSSTRHSSLLYLIKLFHPTFIGLKRTFSHPPDGRRTHNPVYSDFSGQTCPSTSESAMPVWNSIPEWTGHAIWQSILQVLGSNSGFLSLFQFCDAGDEMMLEWKCLMTFSGVETGEEWKTMGRGEDWLGTQPDSPLAVGLSWWDARN